MNTHFNTSPDSPLEEWHNEVTHASKLSSQSQPLMSSHPRLNEFFEGGLPWGHVCEWGSPWGSGGRELALSFLSSIGQSQPYWSLWIQSHSDVAFYPPAWQARGVDLDHLRFAETQEPLKDVKSVFLEPFFKVIVLDSAKLSRDDCAFLKRQAHKHKQAIILIKPYFLSPKQGNIWAKTRLNCWQDHVHQQFHLQVVKGLSPRKIAISC
ncbi:MAG: hypothetical protein HRU19_17265 [Pseudobacteriovorax sp.]|nr:hypothetical protein [Pseudobacteriovorax sp.]